MLGKYSPSVYMYQSREVIEVSYDLSGKAWYWTLLSPIRTGKVLNSQNNQKSKLCGACSSRLTKAEGFTLQLIVAFDVQFFCFITWNHSEEAFECFSIYRLLKWW